MKCTSHEGFKKVPGGFGYSPCECRYCVGRKPEQEAKWERERKPQLEKMLADWERGAAAFREAVSGCK